MLWNFRLLWFGEKLPAPTLQKANQAATSCQVFLSIGTSSIVEPAASLPFLAVHHGADVIEVNPQPTPLSKLVAFTLRGAAGIILPELVQAVW